MGQVLIGLNMEFVRHHDLPFVAGVEKAAAMGYRYIEPMVHWGRELMSEARYYHTQSMFDDPLDVRDICGKYGVQCSGLSAHCPLGRPDVSVLYLTFAIRYAAELGTGIVNTDEGLKAEGTDIETDHILMKYTLGKALQCAEHRKVMIGLEPHQQYTRTPEGLDRIFNLVQSPAMGINFDTGNAYLCGHDPYRWLAHVADRLVHLHAKDISIEQSQAERGKVTGTPVGCACGAGVIDWKEVIRIVRKVERPICLSVECGTIPQAEASIDHLRSLL
jgi:sugar phosphate isomerase/epimerase